MSSLLRALAAPSSATRTTAHMESAQGAKNSSRSSANGTTVSRDASPPASCRAIDAWTAESISAGCRTYGVAGRSAASGTRSSARTTPSPTCAARTARSDGPWVMPIATSAALMRSGVTGVGQSARSAVRSVRGGRGVSERLTRPSEQTAGPAVPEVTRKETVCSSTGVTRTSASVGVPSATSGWTQVMSRMRSGVVASAPSACRAVSRAISRWATPGRTRRPPTEWSRSIGSSPVRTVTVRTAPAVPGTGDGASAVREPGAGSAGRAGAGRNASARAGGVSVAQWLSLANGYVGRGTRR